MLNIIWPLFFIISIVFAFISGNISNLNNSIFEGANSAIETTLTLLGSICLWSGIMNIAMKTSFIEKINKIIKPAIKFLFPEIENNEKISKEVSMNITANILGLGNAATPLGLNAIKSMQKVNKNKDELSNSMIMLIVLNTASLQIIPTTVIAIRSSLNSDNPTKIIVPVWIATIVAAISGISVAKILIKINKNNQTNNK